MKITADKDLYVSTTWGACIRLTRGEVKEVGDDMGYAALQAGATVVKDTPAPKVVKKTTKKKAYVEVEIKTDDKE